MLQQMIIQEFEQIFGVTNLALVLDSLGLYLKENNTIKYMINQKEVVSVRFDFLKHGLKLYKWKFSDREDPLLRFLPSIASFPLPPSKTSRIYCWPIQLCATF